MTPEVWRGPADQLRLLLAVQRAMSVSADGGHRLRRAQLLAAGGCRQAALRDAAAAVEADHSDPTARLVLAGLAPEGGHALACEVVASPFATPTLRQAALRLLDAGRLPLVLSCDLPAALRLTLVQRGADPCTLEGVIPADLPQGLGRAGAVHGTDYYLSRDSHHARTVTVAAGTALHRVTVAPLPQAVAVAGDSATAPLWIILPVKDGGDVLAACLTALAPEIAALPGCRLILVDDASARPETATLLRRWGRRGGVTLLKTPQPLGFTGAVNMGLAAVGQGPVLLLNSDTLVPPGTLDRMLAHLADPTIGTVTPLSNNAGSFSVPAPRVAHRMPDAATCAAIAAEAARRNPGTAVDVLTGNGFCMLVSAACLAATGALSTHYDSGYYEEVDFCLRARTRGFRHVAAVDCFVGHVGATSYGAARTRLIAANSRRIAARHPGYQADYLRFALADPLAPFRSRLTTAAGLAPLDPPDTAPGQPDLTVILPGTVLPVPGPAAAWRGVAGAARAAGLLPVAADGLAAGGLRLEPTPALTATPLPGGGLRACDPAGRPIADLTPGPLAAEVARRIAAWLAAAQTGAGGATVTTSGGR
jgi:GT2 family glycosyltransferase